jgi:type IV secretory pathway TraG/TraD family ATPase VirD4
MGDRERGSVLSTLARSLKWVSDPAMREQLKDSGLRFSDVASGKVKTVWIVLPTRCMDEYARWMRCLINISIRIIESQKKKPKRAVVYVLDEFPKMHGSLEAIEDGIVTLRSAKIKLWPFIQNISQLMRDYPSNWQTFVSSSTVQCFGVNDIETARFISSLLGEKIQTRKEGKRIVSEVPCLLMTPTEVIRELGKTSPMQIVIPNVGPPMRLTRLAHKPVRVEGQQFHASPSGWQVAIGR